MQAENVDTAGLTQLPIWPATFARSAGPPRDQKAHGHQIHTNVRKYIFFRIRNSRNSTRVQEEGGSRARGEKFSPLPLLRARIELRIQKNMYDSRDYIYVLRGMALATDA